MAKGNRTTALTGRRATVGPKTAQSKAAMEHSKKTFERRTVVLKGLRSGLTIEVAASYADVSKQTVRNWRNADPEFDRQCSSARAQLEASLLGRIHIAAADPKTWQAATWLAENLFRDRYGKQSRLELTGRSGGPVAIDVRSMTSEELQRVASGEITYDQEDDE